MAENDCNITSRKGSLLTCGILFTIGAGLFYMCRSMSSVEFLLLGRLIVGLASGLATSTIPMYLSELAPLELRGTLAVLTSMGNFFVERICAYLPIIINGLNFAWILVQTSFLFFFSIFFYKSDSFNNQIT